MTRPVHIVGYEIVRLDVPSGRTFGDCVCSFTNLNVVGVSLKTSRGHVGWGFGETLYGGKYERPAPYITPLPSLAELRARFEQELWPFMRDRNAFELKMARQGPLLDYSPLLQGVRVALWDLMAQEVELPLYRLLGGDPARNRVRAYGSGLDYPLSEEEAVRIFSSFVRRGFTAVKVKVGAPTLERDLRRLQVVREAVGDKVEIAIDANEAWTWEEAARRVRAFREAGIKLEYLEDPLLVADFEGYERLAAATDLDIVGSDYVTSFRQLRRFLEAKVLRRMRAVNEFDQVLGFADLGAEFGIPLIFGNTTFEMNIHAAVALPPQLVDRFEFSDLAWNVIPRKPVQFENGYAIAPEGPGHGLDPKPEMLKELARPNP